MSTASSAPPPLPKPRSRLSSFGLFLTAFLLLVASAVAVGIAQFTSNTFVPWLSIVLSVLAVACTVAALAMGRRG